MNRQNSLWERKITHDDFLSLRIGNGNIAAKIEVNYEKERFGLVDDNLKNLLYEVAGSDKKLENVPVSVSLTDKNIMAITSEMKLGYQFLETMILQMITYHSYEELKIVVLTKEENANYFEFLKLTPFVWNNPKTFRFFGTNKEEINQISIYLLDELMNRKYSDKERNKASTNGDYRNNLPYYVIITDNYKNIRNIEILDKILEEETNLGFSVIALDSSLIYQKRLVLC